MSQLGQGIPQRSLHDQEGARSSTHRSPVTTPAAPSHTNITATSDATNRKSRVDLACKRCKRRKQRCDGSRPSCKACQKAGQACMYERMVRPQYPGGKSLYISALEERIAFLEARLPDHAKDHYNGGADELQRPPNMEPEQPRSDSRGRRESCRDSQSGSVSEDLDLDQKTSLVDGVAYLSLCASGTTDTNHEPYYVGSSSGAAIARVIQSSIYRGSGNKSVDTPAASHAESVPEAPISTQSTAFASLSQPISEFPDPEKARMLFDFFFERIHPRWPLLDRAKYETVVKKQHSPESLTITERSILHLIYAITARFLAVTKKSCGVDDEPQLIAATGPMEHILKQHDLATVQFLILLGVHGQRSPYGAGAWSQIRYATSVCIEMGLHRERSMTDSSQNMRDAEIRRRAFWSAYCLDRVTSIVLGRAFAIADRDINVELPNTSPEFWTLTHQEAYDPLKNQWSNVQPFVHIIKLDRIQSRIHKAVFRVDKDVLGGTPEERTKFDQKMVTIRKDLDDWIQSFPRTPKNDNKSTWMYDPESAYLDARDFYGVQYHKAILFLFTVFLPVLETSDARFVTCARSAACVCNAYKRLSQNKTLTYTMISLHSCFVAGLTLVYCIWRDRKLFSYEVLEATQACSQILTIFGEKWPGAVKYRDIFDALSGSLFRLTVKPANTIPKSRRSSSLQLNMAAGSFLNGKATNDRQESQAPVSSDASLRSDVPTMSHLLTDAVKEAFMEVDEEAPGGWQGWRMWNEMMRNDDTHASQSAFRYDGVVQEPFETCWNPYDEFGGYGIDPIEDAAMQEGNSVMVDQCQWDFAGYK